MKRLCRRELEQVIGGCYTHRCVAPRSESHNRGQGNYVPDPAIAPPTAMFPPTWLVER